MAITPITDSAELKEFCRRQSREAYITVDTEFLPHAFVPELREAFGTFDAHAVHVEVFLVVVVFEKLAGDL